MKKVLSILLAVCLLAGPSALLAHAAATETDAQAEDGVTMTSIADVAKFILEPHRWGEIQITPAVLSGADGARDVYLVALRGTGFTMKKANNVVACFLSAFNITTEYYTMTLEAIYQYVPEGATIVFAGHSLGGMIEQQLSCTEELTAKYEILKTVNMGSPYVLADASKREGPLVRFAEKTDIIPRLSPAVFVNLKAYNDMTIKDGGYLFDPNSAHNLSYMRVDEWGEYDVLGVLNGGATLTVAYDDVVVLRA
ncbi:MAG: hypothetical protein IJK89_03890 [Clostridia bacterium]|nr:hypothetical protein [Clostridia bacterium]